MAGITIEGSQQNIMIEGNSTELIAGDNTTTVGGALTFTTVGAAWEFALGGTFDTALGYDFAATVGFVTEINWGPSWECNYSGMGIEAPTYEAVGLLECSIGSPPSIIEMTPLEMSIEAPEINVIGEALITITCGTTVVMISAGGVTITSDILLIEAPDINLTGNVVITGNLEVTGTSLLTGAVTTPTTITASAAITDTAEVG